MKSEGERKKPGRKPKPPATKELINDIIPTESIFDKEEEKMYIRLVEAYKRDFDEDNLTASDMDDIITMATNKVLEMRLLAGSKSKVKGEISDLMIDASTAVERLRKQTDKIKENLASRRKDRIDPKKFSGFSIVDLAVAYDVEKKNSMFERSQKYLQEEKELYGHPDLIGNSEDIDAEIVDGSEIGEKNE